MLQSPILSHIVHRTKMIKVESFSFTAAHKSHMISFSIINVKKVHF